MWSTYMCCYLISSSIEEANVTNTIAPRRRDVMQGISEDPSLAGGRRVIAFDRPPFGLTERPLQWDTSAWDP